MKLESVLLLIACVLVTYWQSAFDGLRRILAVQPDLLPSLVVYGALSSGLGSVTLVAVAGGLLMDSLSANPLGVTTLPLFIAGFLIIQIREYILRTESFAQVVLGAAAGFISPVLVLLILSSRGEPPVLGWGTLWQLTVLTCASAVATPLWFWCFDFLKSMLMHERLPETSFRADREIRRGR